MDSNPAPEPQVLRGHLGHLGQGRPDLSERTFWVILGAIVAVGALTRFLFLGRIYLWVDETPIVSGALWADHGTGLKGLLRGMRALSLDVHRHYTFNGTLAAVILGLCRSVGAPTLWWARLPVALASVLLLPALAGLTRQVSGSSIAGLAAAGAATASIAQNHYAQQAMPYGPAVLAAALVIWAAVAWCARISDAPERRRWLPAGFLFFVAATAAVALHNSSLPVVVVCTAGLAVWIAASWWRRRIPASTALRHLAALGQAGLALGLCILIFVLPKLGDGFRGYLLPYYAASGTAETPLIERGVAAASFAMTRAYDLVAFAFNPAYSDALYRPLGLNPVTLLPLALLPVGVAALWRRSRGGRFFTALAVASVVSVLAGAVLRRYPFGGVRQCLPLTVFMYVLAGTGLAIVYRRFRRVALCIVGLWLALWLAALPQFYAQRLSPYDGDALARQMVRNGCSVLATANDLGWPEHRVFGYHLREHPDVLVRPLPDVLDAAKDRRQPFVLASTTKDLARLRTLCQSDGESRLKERLALAELLSEEGLTLTPLAEVTRNRVAPPHAQEDDQSIYCPLNGLYLYKVTWKAPQVALH